MVALVRGILAVVVVLLKMTVLKMEKNLQVYKTSKCIKRLKFEGMFFALTTFYS